MPRALVLIFAVLAVSACASKDRDIGLRDLRSFTGGPDEFLVLPGKELQQPSDYASLPTPTPGGANLTDQNPLGDGVEALGGRATAMALTDGVPAADTTLINHVSRNGVSADIRETLAEEDEKVRRRIARISQFQIFKIDRYNRAYRRYVLDPSVEVEKWRRLGVQTPSAPPAR